MTITKGTKYITDPNTIPINTSFANDVLPTLLNTLNTNTSNHIGSTSAHSSTDITYDNTSSGLTATNAKAAIDEVESRVDTVEANKIDSNSEASLLNIAKEEITTATTGSLNLDVSTASSFLVNVSGTIDITLSGTTLNKTHQVYVEAINSAGSLAWTTAITWDGGVEPALGTNFTIYYLVYLGGTWYGKAIISN